MENPEQQPSPSDAKREGQARLRQLLAQARMQAEALARAVDKAFPETAKRYSGPSIAALSALSVEAKIALGDRSVQNLTEVAFALAPDAAIDGVEPRLTLDTSSHREATALLRKLQTSS